jgi:sulfate/thiosulfate-binding protein
MPLRRSAAIAIAMTLGGCATAGARSGAALTLVASSTPHVAYNSIIDAFARSAAGDGVTATTSFGASGDQSRAVVAGLDADVVAFALEPDITRLVAAGLVSADWNADGYHGMVTDSVVVLVVRKGNPEHITGWDDLVRDGIEVITPNPFTSGGARWNVMAAYGQAMRGAGGVRQAGIDYLTALFDHVAVQDGSARKALQTFTSGKGDVMLAYENEAIFAQKNGRAIDYVVPDSTILIENPAAVTTSAEHPIQAEAFLDFVRSPQAQAIFAEDGYRPVVAGAGASGFPTPADLFTIGDLGGWVDVSDQFFDPMDSVMAGIERNIGASVG